MQQAEAIKKDDIEQLLSLIKEREELIAKINELDQNIAINELNQLKDENSYHLALKKGLTAGTKEDFEEKLIGLNNVRAEIKELLAKTKQIETKNIFALNNRKQDLASKIQNQQKTKRTASYYHKKPTVGRAAFIDKKG